MVQRIAALMTLLGVALLAALPQPLLAFQPGDGPPIVYQAPSALSAPPGFSAEGRRRTIMIELGEPSAPGALTLAGAVERSRRIAAEQALLAQPLAALDAQVLFQTRLAYNGIAVSVAPEHLDALRLLPGVVGVHAITPKQRSNAAAIQFVGAPAAWSGPQGATGTGIRIGIVDSGIDYTHADFGGPGTAQFYRSNNPAVIEPGSFPTAKVVGGYDFAGDAYDADGVVGSPIPAPDPDPLDCNGHGTHVAGTAAGFGVAADGSTYRGPYVSGMDLASFLVGPGVAPGAGLYALKVFGCQGSTALMALAIERALDPNGDGDPSDHLDVLNISLGSPFGGADDPDAVALDNAVRAGIVAVVAAGDTGDTFYATDAPASARLAITVGASIDAARATAQAPADSVAPFSARGPARGGMLKPDLVAPGVDIRSAAVGSGSGARPMSGTSTAAPQAAGTAALLRQMHPGWTPAQIKAALMNTAAPVRMADGQPAPPSVGGAGRLDVSRLASLDMLAYADDEHDTAALSYGAPWADQPFTATRLLRVENRSDAVREVTLTATAVVTEPGILVALPPGPIAVQPHAQIVVPITLRVDPRLLDFSPDAATPLEQDGLLRYFLAEHGGYVAVGSGTGVRVRPAHAAHFRPVDFYLDQQLLDEQIDPGEVQEYSDTTAGVHTVRVVRSGAPSQATPLVTAQVQFEEGHDYTLILVGQPGPFGIVVVDETAPAPPPGQALLHFVNANSIDRDWNVGPLDIYLDGVLRTPALPVGQASDYAPLSPGPHTVYFYRAGVDPARQRAVASVTFVASAGELILVGSGRHDDDADRPIDDLDPARQRAFVGRGLPGTSLVLRVPFQIFPKSASDAHVADPPVSVPLGARTFTAGLRNDGARGAGLNGSVASPQTALASAFELAATSPPLAALTESLRAADVRYVGVTSSFSVVPSVAGTTIFFGLASYGPWSTPNEVEFLVYIDTNLDGTDDFVVLNSNWGAFFNRPSDAFFSPIYKILPDGQLQAIAYTLWGTLGPPTSPYGFDVSAFNTSVMFQAVGANTIGLAPGQTRLRYHVETRARDAGHFGRVVDRVPALGELEYDLAQPAIAPINLAVPNLAQRPVFVDSDGGQITGAVTPAVLAARGSQQLLVLHHHNLPPAQAEVVEVRGVPPSAGQAPANFRVFAPLVTGSR